MHAPPTCLTGPMTPGALQLAFAVAALTEHGRGVLHGGTGCEYPSASTCQSPRHRALPRTSLVAFMSISRCSAVLRRASSSSSLPWFTGPAHLGTILKSLRLDLVAAAGRLTKPLSRCRWHAGQDWRFINKTWARRVRLGRT